MSMFVVQALSWLLHSCVLSASKFQHLIQFQLDLCSNEIAFWFSNGWFPLSNEETQGHLESLLHRSTTEVYLGSFLISGLCTTRECSTVIACFYGQSSLSTTWGNHRTPRTLDGCPFHLKRSFFIIADTLFMRNRQLRRLSWCLTQSEFASTTWGNRRTSRTLDCCLMHLRRSFSFGIECSFVYAQQACAPS